MWQTSWAAQGNDEAISHWPHRKLSVARMKINKNYSPFPYLMTGV